MKRWLGPLLLMWTGSASADPTVLIEKATVPWAELERLLRSQHATVVRPRPSAPLSYALGGLVVTGRVEREVARLELEIEIQLLSDQWIEAPLLPGAAAIASAEVEGLRPGAGVITRREEVVAFIGRGPGTARIRLCFELALRPEPGGLRLSIAPLGLSAGRARLELSEDFEKIGGATRWRPVAGGRSSIEATLGREGLSLLLSDRETGGEVAESLEELEAVSSVTLGGSGVTRVRLRATPDARGVLELVLPEGAAAWRLFVGSRAIPVAQVSDGRYLRVPLRGESAVELVYTFAGEGLGIRGRYRAELPRLRQPVRSAAWDLWLPSGLRYGPAQASLGARPGCGRFRGKVEIDAQGECHGFAKPVLGAGAAYVEIDYDQP